jgi:hypothetical protein
MRIDQQPFSLLERLLGRHTRRLKKRLTTTDNG